VSGKATHISLPQGGGAVRGLGENFQPDLHTGTASLSVPIQVPAGRGGLRPGLTLSYNTGHPNGPFGLGWALSVPSIRRKTTAGVPRYGGSDTFVLSGAEDLVAVPGGDAGRTRYRPRVEGAFARIEHVTADGNDYWEVSTGDGLVSRYGTPRPAGAAGDWRDPAAVGDPADPRRTFGWLLSQTTDLSGNLIRYGYERDGDPAALGYDQLRLADISYVDHPVDSGSGSDSGVDFLVRIVLRYEQRPDVFSDRRAGFEIRTTSRCTGIETWTRPWAEPGSGPADGPVPVLAQVVHLEYDAAASGSGRSLLTKLSVEGRDGDATQHLPALEFGYTAFTPSRRRYQRVSAGPGGDLPASSLASAELALVDLFGNGLPSVLQMNGQVRYWRNLGGAVFDASRPMAAAPPVGLAESGVQLADMDGDGRADLLVSQAPLSGYYPLTSGGRFDARGFVPYPAAPAVNLEDPQVRLVDLDGDGVIDALRTGSSVELYYNNGDKGWSSATLLTRGSAAPDLDLADPHVKLADMTGDGLTDLVLVHDRRLEYWPYLGYGRWGRSVSMAGAPRFADAAVYASTDFDPHRLLIGDVDGDGAADVVYVGDGQVTVWINRSGHGFAEPVVITGTPRVSDTDAVRLVDLLGTGTAGILWSADAGTYRGGGYAFLDLTGGTKPYLLETVDNHRGCRTRIEYAPSTRDYLADTAAGRPWRTTLPFPVQVVASTSTYEEFSGTTVSARYRYHHGYWDGAEREFRGFARVDRFDTVAGPEGQHWSPPTETRTWFHPGPVGPARGNWSELDFGDEYWSGDPDRLPPTTLELPAELPRRAYRDAVRALAGRPLRTELYARDGDAGREVRPYTVTEHRYGLTAVLDGRPVPDWTAAPVVFAHPVAERTTQWERGDDPMHHHMYTGGYDQYGRARLHAEAGVPRGHDPASGTGDATAGRFLMTASVTEYATRDDAERYLVDRVAAATRLEVIDDGSTGLAGLWAAVLAGTAATRLLGHQVNHYDGDPFTGLDFGRLGDRGLLTRTAQLVHTDATLAAACVDDSGQVELPPYLDPNSPGWPGTGGAGYPDGFRSGLPFGAGYTRRTGVPGYRDGWYAETGTAYDAQGNVRVARDARGYDATAEYDRYGLLPVRVTDAVGLIETADYDYRVLMPALTTDANGNRTAYTYTPLGLVASVAALGKPGEQVGDTPQQPGTRYEYGLTAYDDSAAGSRQPTWAHTTRRVRHRWDLVADENQQRAAAGQPPLTDAEIAAMFPPDERDRFGERFLRVQEFSDGLGRPLQTRAQADDVVLDDLGLPADLITTVGDAVTHRQATGDPPRVAVSGWQTYDNKGRVVEKYEPAFDVGWDYAPPGPPVATDPTAPPVETGLLTLFPRKVTMFYDPRGHLIRTVRPDRSEEVVVPGVPVDLTDPTRYRPTPWESYAYDSNDNAGRTHPTASAGYATHWNTPASQLVDALGRVVESARRLAGRAVVTRTRYDIDGNVVEVIDPLGRVASRAAYDLLKRVWRTKLLDAGVVRQVCDPVGGVVERRDAKGARTLTGYDALNRPVRVWAGDLAEDPVTLRQLVYHGDATPDLGRAAAAAANLLGTPYLAYDDAGLVTTVRRDLHGNPVQTERRVLATDVLLSTLPGAGGDWSGTGYRADWSGTDPDALLDPTRYEVTSRFDAIGRRTAVTCPTDVEQRRTTVTAGYDRAGRVTAVAVDGKPYLRQALYDAHGHRVLAVLGNGVMIRYAYDPDTFRLERLRSEMCAERAGDTGWRPAGTVHQDHGYRYDLVGNLLTLFDRTPGCGVPPGAPDALDRQFGYDPLYRLVSATGRECAVSTPPPWTDIPRCTDVTRTRAYTESYDYTDAGGLLHLAHLVATAPSSGFARDFVPVPGSNQLAVMTTGGATYDYHYDQCGNLLTEAGSRHHEWDHANRLATFRTQPAGSSAEPSVYAQYRYDAAGQRVVKVRRDQGGALAVTVYIGDLFERLVLMSATGTQTVHDTVHVVDSARRVALKRIGPSVPDDPAPAVLYPLVDHLGSATAVLDDTGALVNREEYTPYGETSFGSYARKRYRFTGKERDEESSLNYHGARYYAPWLARWTSPDPLGIADSPDVYAYVQDNPLRNVDPRGTETTPSDARWDKNRQNDTRRKARERASAQREAAAAGKTPDPMAAREATAKAATGRSPVQQHHHADIENAKRLAGADPKAVGDTRRMSSLWSTEDRVAYGGMGDTPAWSSGFTGDRYTHHNVADRIDAAEQAQRPSTAADHIQAAAAGKARLPATVDMTERARMDWTRTVPKGPPVDEATGLVVRAEKAVEAAGIRWGRQKGAIKLPEIKLGSLSGGGLTAVVDTAHFAAGLALSYATNALSMALMSSAADLNEKQREQMGTALGALPPGADVVAAGNASLLARIFSAVIDDHTVANMYGVSYH
jgi:RHS repeat-associated protein